MFQSEDRPATKDDEDLITIGVEPPLSVCPYSVAWYNHMAHRWGLEIINWLSLHLPETRPRIYHNR